MGQLMGHYNGQDPDDIVEAFEQQEQQARDIEAGVDPLDVIPLRDTDKSAHQLRAELRGARIQQRILERKVKALQDCLTGKHQTFKDVCITCEKDLR